MSGGGLNDWDENSRLYQIDEWRRHIEPQNPVLAEMLGDLRELLHAYDYWLAGDYGKEDAEKAWKEFRTKWMTDDTTVAQEILLGKMEALARSLERGWTEDA